MKTFVALIAVAVLTATPALAGHGSVSYENQLKAEQKEKRAQQAPSPPVVAPPSAPAATPAAAATPAGAVTVPVRGVDGDHAFATTARRQLSEVAGLAEAQAAGGTDPKLKAIAKQIAENQRKDMAELDAWLSAHPQQGSAK